MNELNLSALKQRSHALLRDHAPEYRKTVLLHSALAFGVLTVLLILDLVLSSAIGNTGGLADMGTRGVLETVRSVLSTAANLLLPFWEIGLLFTAIRVARQQDHSFSMLTQGFHRFGPVLRYLLLQIVILMVVATLCTNVLMFASILLPVPASLEQAMASIQFDAMTDPATIMQQLPVDELLSYMLPILILFTILYAGVLIHLHYRFRFGQYLLMDETRCGAIQALRSSNDLTRGSKWQLFKLDLSFWWYYLLGFVCSLIAQLPVLLELLDVSLPVSSTLFQLLTYLIYTGCSLAVTWWAGAYVQTTYACAYQQLLSPPPTILE